MSGRVMSGRVVSGRAWDRPATVMAAVLAVLVLIEWLAIPHKHPAFPWHHLPGYAACIGLFSCLIVVLLSKQLGKRWLQRPEAQPPAGGAPAPEPRRPSRPEPDLEPDGEPHHD